MSTVANVSVKTWATAISRQSDGGRKLFWRFAESFHRGFRREEFADRVIFVWRYESSSGQPDPDEHARMDLLEDLVEPITDNGNFAVLALVSTGQNWREWIYYAQSGEAFLERLNAELASVAPFPIEISVDEDRNWTTYDRFRAEVVGKA